MKRQCNFSAANSPDCARRDFPGSAELAKDKTKAKAKAKAKACFGQAADPEQSQRVPPLGNWEQLGSCRKSFRDGRMQVKRLQLWKILDSCTELTHFRRFFNARRILLSAQRTAKVLEHLCGELQTRQVEPGSSMLLLASCLQGFYQRMDVFEGTDAV